MANAPTVVMTNHINTTRRDPKYLVLGALGALAVVALGCAPLPPCPRTPDGNLIVVANADEGTAKQDAGAPPVLDGISNQKAKEIGGADRGPDSGAAARVREGTTEKELRQQSKVESEEPKKPTPPACRP